MSKLTLHIIPKSNNRWGLQRSRSTRASKLFLDEDKAIESGIKVSKSKKAVLIIHRRSGTIRSTKNYGI